MKNDIFRFVALPPDARRSSRDTDTIRPVPAELGLTDVPNRKGAARSVADRGHGRGSPRARIRMGAVVCGHRPTALA
jgi:hypothetical protein